MRKRKGRKGCGQGIQAYSKRQTQRRKRENRTGNLAKRVNLKGSQHTHNYAREQKS